MLHHSRDATDGKTSDVRNSKEKIFKLEQTASGIFYPFVFFCHGFLSLVNL